MKYIFEYGLWENDFFLNEILPKGEVEYIRQENIESTENICDVFAFAYRFHNFFDIRNTIRRIKPKVVIMTSDEFYQENNSIYIDKLQKIISINISSNINIIGREIITKTDTDISYIKNFIPKKLKWSWFGEIKSDRIQMLNQFRQLTSYLIGNSLPKEVMCKIYSESMFVPCGRGNSSLDCYRLYEASMNGAIPVIVGSKEEIESTFKYEENPPWIFAETWNEAVEKCMSTEINSQSVIEWWNRRISKIKTKVMEVL